MKTLESEVSRHRAQSQPYARTLYVIPDVFCLVTSLKYALVTFITYCRTNIIFECTCVSLRQFKEIVSMQRFFIIVPQVAISGLDDLKKGNDWVNRGAREAIRWLEEKFRQVL